MEPCVGRRGVVKPGEAITVKVLRVDEDTQKIALGLKQLSDDPWSKVPATYEVGQVRSGRVTRLAEFGAFVELEPGVEALAHASTFAPTGRSETWSRSVSLGMTGAFEILNIDFEKRRIGVALVPEGSTRAFGAVPSAKTTGAALDLPDDQAVSEYQERSDETLVAGFGSLGDKLRGALEPRNAAKTPKDT